MFGTKIRSWMEAQIARSRAKKKDRPGSKAGIVAGLPSAHLDNPSRPLDAKFFGARADFNEILPALPISPSSFKPHHHPRNGGHQHPLKPDQRQYSNGASSNGQQQQQQQVSGNSAVNLSSPESAYSTGYSTDGTSPCATYAPEYYINVRAQQQQQQQQQQQRPLPSSQLLDARVRGRRPEGELRGQTLVVRNERQQIDNTGTYSVSAQQRGRGYLDPGKEYCGGEHHPWRKPAPPTTSRPVNHLGRKSYGTECGTASYPLQLFSPRRMPMVATTSTQVMPIKSPRQCSRLRTSPWQAGVGRLMNPRPWSRQQQSYANDYCCRQESLSVGRSPVNRSDWRGLAQRYGKSTRSSSASSCSSRSRSRSCSVSSSSKSNSNSAASNPSSPSSDDITLNEVMGKFDENYLYEKETDIVSDHSGLGLDGSCDNLSSSVNFSSDASASSLDGAGSTSRSTSRHQLRGLSGRRQRRRKHRRSVQSNRDDEDKEHREEVELLQEVLHRRFKKNNSEASAQTNRALLERLLMKNASSGYGEGRRAWSDNPGLLRPTAASRSVGGTPICLRRTTSRTGPRHHVLSPPSRLIFERNHQVYPAESTTSLKNMSASELALMEADKEADLKYAQLIMEAERMLINVQQQLNREESSNNSRRGSLSPVVAENSPSRFPRMAYQQQQQQGSAPNKRVELIKNAELNIELALSKSRNSQPELSSGSIKDLLDHSSPKRLLHQQQKKIIEPVLSQVAASTQTGRTDLTAFQSLDVNPAAMLKGTSQSEELSSTSELYSCPQSEPVKRKIYEGQDVGGMLQRQAPPWLRNSDGDCASEQSPPQLQSASATSSYSQLKKHMLIETLQGLKQSLEDQSAALKMSCLRPL